MSDEEEVPPENADPVVSTTLRPITHRDLAEWRGRDVLDCAGERIGPLEEVYYDADDDRPLFGTVKEGFLSRHLTFVPLAGAIVGPDSLQVAVTAEQIKQAPTIGSSGEQLTPDEEAQLFHHYQLNYAPSTRESERRLIRH